MDSKILLETLKQGSSNKVKESLEAIYEICLEQKERGLTDFSIATISRLGHKRGVPKAQSIRNKTGEKYRALIQSFSDTIEPLKMLQKVSKTEEDWISEISNPKHQILVRILVSELKEAKQIINEMIPPKQRIEIYDHKLETYSSSTFKLTELEVRALRHLLTVEFQKEWYLSETGYGGLVNEQNKTVFKSGTLDALRKALEQLS